MPPSRIRTKRGRRAPTVRCRRKSRACTARQRQSGSPISEAASLFPHACQSQIRVMLTTAVSRGQVFCDRLAPDGGRELLAVHPYILRFYAPAIEEESAHVRNLTPRPRARRSRRLRGVRAHQPIAFIGAAQAQAPAPSFHKYKVGDLEVISLYDGVWEKPHDENFIKGANVEQTKAALKAGRPDRRPSCPSRSPSWRSGRGGRLVLINSGTGGGQTGGPKAGLLPQSMAAAGLDPKAVKTILISHFHGDHIFGLMAKDTNAQIFPDAEIIVPAAELMVDAAAQLDPAAAPRPRAAHPGHACRPGRTSSWSTAKPTSRRHSRDPGVRPHPGPHRPSDQLRRQATARHRRRHQHLRRCSPRIRTGRRRSITCRTWRSRRARSCSIALSPTRPWSPAITGACRTSAPSPRTATATPSRRPLGDDESGVRLERRAMSHSVRARVRQSPNSRVVQNAKPARSTVCDPGRRSIGSGVALGKFSDSICASRIKGAPDRRLKPVEAG